MSLIVVFGIVRIDNLLRSQYHLMLVKNWFNDPNGPVYYNGYYHMFFQMSKRIIPIIHWIHSSIALAFDRSYDINGIFTGSTIIVDGILIIIYTDITNENRQVQCQAKPA